MAIRSTLALAAALAVATATAGCAALMHQHDGAPDGAKEVARAYADIAGDGGITGKATFIQFENGTGSGVRVIVDVQGDPSVLTPGLHGFHVHQTAECGSSYKAAGGHFDPGPHGVTSVAGNHPWHLGDLPNLAVDDNGHGHLDAVTMDFTITPGPRTLFDEDGSAVIVHAEEDEWTGARAGGGRIACGVIAR